MTSAAGIVLLNQKSRKERTALASQEYACRLANSAILTECPCGGLNSAT